MPCRKHSTMDGLTNASDGLKEERPLETSGMETHSHPHMLIYDNDDSAIFIADCQLVKLFPLERFSSRIYGRRSLELPLS